MRFFFILIVIKEKVNLGCSNNLVIICDSFELKSQTKINYNAKKKKSANTIYGFRY